MKLYYLNKQVNTLRLNAKKSSYCRWRLGELLYEAEKEGYVIEQDKESGEITIMNKKGGV